MIIKIDNFIVKKLERKRGNIYLNNFAVERDFYEEN